MQIAISQLAKLSMDDMEDRGSHGVPRPWSYRRREQVAGPSSSYTVISSSSSAGTIVSTAYTSSAGTGTGTCTGSHRHFSTPTFHCVGIHDGGNVAWEETDKEEQMKRITSLVQECFGAPPPSTDSSIRCSDDTTCWVHMIALERWFTELGVSWVLHVASSSGELGNTTTSTFDTWSWIRALAEIMETIHLTTSLSPIRDTDTGNQATDSSPDQLKFVQFFHGTMLKMLVFVDVLVREVVVAKGVPVPYMKLSNLLGVHGALSKALSEIWLLFHSPPSAQVQAVEHKIASLLSTKEARAGEAVWSTIEQIRACVHESMDDDDAPLQASSGIHKSTVSVLTYIKFLQNNYLSVAPIVSEAASLGMYVPQIRNIRPLDSMIIEIVSCLQEKLANSSESFQDKALGFLFLLNNSYFIRENLDLPFSSINNVHMESITCRVKAYMDSYIQVSWAPVLSSLLNPAPLCFRRNNYSRLPKFESEFQKIYTAQRQWKVPDPKLRKTLHKAITEKVILEYTEYMEDNKDGTPKFSPRELEEMLQELFEG